MKPLQVICALLSCYPAVGATAAAAEGAVAAVGTAETRSPQVPCPQPRIHLRPWSHSILDEDDFSLGPPALALHTSHNGYLPQWAAPPDRGVSPMVRTVGQRGHREGRRGPIWRALTESHQITRPRVWHGESVSKEHASLLSRLRRSEIAENCPICCELMFIPERINKPTERAGSLFLRREEPVLQLPCSHWLHEHCTADLFLYDKENLDSSERTEWLMPARSSTSSSSSGFVSEDRLAVIDRLQGILPCPQCRSQHPCWLVKGGWARDSPVSRLDVARRPFGCGLLDVAAAAALPSYTGPIHIRGPIVPEPSETRVRRWSSLRVLEPNLGLAPAADTRSVLRSHSAPPGPGFATVATKSAQSDGPRAEKDSKVEKRQRAFLRVEFSNPV